MPSGGLTTLNRYTTSLVVKWIHMKNPPDDEGLYRYYSYYVKYREKVSSNWISGLIIPYNPDVDPPQATIDGLISGTEYVVRILGVRTKGDQTDEETAEKTNTKTFTTLFGTYSLYSYSFYVSEIFCRIPFVAMRRVRLPVRLSATFSTITYFTLLECTLYFTYRSTMAQI